MKTFDFYEKPESFDPTMVGHGRSKNRKTPKGKERCDNEKCSWTEDYPAAPGANQEAGNSYYHYHKMQGLR